MNIFTRFGNWMDERRVLRKPDLETIRDNVLRQAAISVELIKRANERIDILKKDIESQNLSALAQKEFALINARLNRIELLTGLKREPQSEKVPGATRIS